MADDADVTNDLSTGRTVAGGVGVAGEWDDSGTSGSVTVGGYEVLRLDPLNDPPLVGDGVGIRQSAARMISGEGDWGELTDIGANVADLALNGVIYGADPLNYLLSAGLGFLIDVVQPLQDLLGLVTGNGERMGAEISKWERVGRALGPPADEIRQAADEGLVGWQGQAAEAAKQRLHGFADGVSSLTNDVDQLVMIMSLAKTLMETAEQLVISLIATFIEWLIFTWVPALAAAAPTFGASTAAAGAATSVEAVTTTTRAVSFIERVMMILKRLKAIVHQMHPRMMKRVQAAFQLRGADGRFAKGWVSSPHALGSTARDWRTWAQPGVKLATGATSDIKSIVDGSGGHRMSDRELDQALGGDG